MISNMYPSEKFPAYGTFVQVFFENLSENYSVSKVVLTKKSGKISKIIGYLVFYIRIAYEYLFRNYDIYYIHYPSHVSQLFLFLRRVKQKKIYINVHGSDIVPETSLGKKILPYTKKILEECDKIIVPSEYFLSYLKTSLHIENENIVVFPSGGINSKVFNQRKSKTIQNRNLNIAFVSRVDEGKGWDTYVKSIHYLRSEFNNIIQDVSFYLIGSGSQSNQLDQLVNRLCLNDLLIQMPSMSQKELSIEYQNIDCVIFPSRRIGESLGLVGLEAMSMSIPVIGSNMNGIATYITDGQEGFLFDPTDFKQLANSIIRFLLLSNDDRLNMGSNAYDRSINYLDINLKDKISMILEDEYER